MFRTGGLHFLEILSALLKALFLLRFSENTQPFQEEGPLVPVMKIAKADLSLEVGCHYMIQSSEEAGLCVEHAEEHTEEKSINNFLVKPI